VKRVIQAVLLALVYPFALAACEVAVTSETAQQRYDDGMLVFNLAQPGETVTMTAIWEE